jgi:predicted HAD superfamily phosphohydrolase YqeG
LDIPCTTHQHLHQQIGNYLNKMAEEQAAHHLLNVLEERGLDAGLDLDNVLAAFENDDTKKEAAAWVNEYLNQETLLTKEEFEL